MEAGEVEGGGASEVEGHGERDGVGVGCRRAGAGLEDAEGAKGEGEDAGGVGGGGGLEVLAELEAGEGEALVGGRQGGLEAGEGGNEVVGAGRRLERLLCRLRGRSDRSGEGRRRPRGEVAAGPGEERGLGFGRGNRNGGSEARSEEERGGSA